LGVNPALHQVEEAMRAAAEEVLGYKPPPSGRKPFKDKTTRTAQEEVKAARALLKRLKANAGVTDDLMEQITKVTGWECPAGTELPTREVLNRLLGEELRKTITVTRREIAKRVQETQRKNLTEACKKKRHTLDHGKGAIQRAMGKSCQYDTIEELITRHPDTVRLRVSVDSEPTANQICGTVEKRLGIKVQVSTTRQEQSTDLILNIQPKERWRIPEILRMCQEENWHIGDLHCERKNVTCWPQSHRNWGMKDEPNHNSAQGATTTTPCAHWQQGGNRERWRQYRTAQSANWWCRKNRMRHAMRKYHGTKIIYRQISASQMHQ
jgi:hypothetical protein